MLKKSSIQTGKGAKKGFKDNQGGEEHMLPRDYKLDLFSPTD